jgi:hypothetical protein
MKGDLLVPCSNGYVHNFKNENNQTFFSTMNNANTSELIPTNLNKYDNEITLIFMTNKYGFLNN